MSNPSQSIVCYNYVDLDLIRLAESLSLIMDCNVHQMVSKISKIGKPAKNIRIAIKESIKSNVSDFTFLEE